MSKHMTIINLACTITKLRKWGEAWKHSAESAQAATARMHQAHEAKMVEHRAAFGARTEADAKIIAGLRSEVEASEGECNVLRPLVVDAAKYKTERDHFYQREGIEQKRRMDAESERDALRAEVEFLKTLRPKYKVGDKLESYNRSLGLAIPVTIVGVRTVYDCQADGAEYPVGHSEDELTERYEQTPPEATHAEPDLTQLHAKGKEAWSDVPNATQWVEEMRGNSEATHDTVQGKAAAESAAHSAEIDIGTRSRKVTT